MSAIRAVFRSELQHRWRSWLALVVLVALVGGTVLAAAAASRRTASAFPRFVSRYGFDAQVLSYPTPLPRALGSLPGVTSVSRELEYLSGNLTVQGRIVPGNDAVVSSLPSDATTTTKLVAGRMPTAADEVLAGFTLQQQYRVPVGSVVTVSFYSPSQARAIENGNPPPRGKRFKFRVVGIEANVTDFPAGVAPVYNLYTARAFDEGEGRQTLSLSAGLVRLRRGAADLPRFQVAFNNLPGLAAIHYVQSEDTGSTAVERSIHPQAVGWWLFALFVGLVGLAVVGQAMSRQSLLEAESYPTLEALGLRPRQVFTLGMGRALAIGLFGAAGAVGLAFALSPLTPVGEARIAEPSPGFSFDSLALGLGALGTVVATLLLSAYPAWRETRARADQPHAERGASRASLVVGALARTGAPASVVVGTSRALERGRGRTSVPVLTGLLGAVVAVSALVATAVFGASLSNLVSTPALYGMNWQVDLNSLDYHMVKTVVNRSAHDDAITKITSEVTSKFISINGITVQAILAEVEKGPMAFSLVAGRYPTGYGQIALGSTTMSQVGAHLGSKVSVKIIGTSGKPETARFTDVGTVAVAPEFGTGGFGTGAVMTVLSAVGAICPPGRTEKLCASRLKAKLASDISWEMSIGTAPNAAGRATALRLERRYASQLTPASVPADLVNFGEAVNFPVLLGLTLAIFGAAVLAHLLLVSVARRRREVAVLKVIGFVRRQVSAAVCWQSLTIALVGIVLGVPIGTAAGRLIWRLFASNLGVVPVDVVPAGVIALFAVGVLVIGCLLALLPAGLAARTRPAVALREP